MSELWEVAVFDSEKGKIIVPITAVVARNKQAATIKAVRLIPPTVKDAEKLEVVARPFSGGR